MQVVAVSHDLDLRTKGLMAEFVLVDLASVAQHLQGLSAAEKLAWLRQRGEVIDNPIRPDEYTGFFRSCVGLETVFRLTADGTLLIIFAVTFDVIDPLEQEIYRIRWDWSGPRQTTPL